jgi:hypothetical protein
MMSKNDKKFDCVEFKRQQQERIYQDIKNKKPSQQIEYFKQRVEQGPFAAWWGQVRAARVQPAGRKKTA